MKKKSASAADRPAKKSKAKKPDLTAVSDLIDARWFPIDNASNLYALSYRRHWNRTFRIAAVLDEVIQPDVMQRALGDTALRFPSFCAKLRTGFFWPYFERIGTPPQLTEEDNLPYRAIPLTGTHQPNFRVQYYKKRISVEMFHALADAPATVCFLGTLITRYYELQGAAVTEYNGVYNCADMPTNAETVDPYFEKAVPCKSRNPEKLRTFFMKRPVKRRYASVVHGIMRVDDVKAVAKNYGVTITEYFTAVLMHSYLTMTDKPIDAPLRVSIPINLRTRLDMDSARNFVYMFDVNFDPQGRTDVSLAEICAAIAGQIREKAAPPHILEEISANVSAQKNPLSRMVPAVLKRQVLKKNYKKSQLSFTTFLSNFGVMELPEAIAPHVKRAEFVLGGTPFQPVGFACASVNGILTLSVCADTADMKQQRIVFRALTDDGIPVRIESNFHDEVNP